MSSPGFEYVRRPVHHPGSQYRSTAEYLTGRIWIDGRPLYEKVVLLGALPNIATNLVAHGIADIATMVELAGAAQDGTDFHDLASLADVFVNATNVSVTTTANQSAFTGVAILRFTKSA